MPIVAGTDYVIGSKPPARCCASGERATEVIHGRRALSEQVGCPRSTSYTSTRYLRLKTNHINRTANVLPSAEKEQSYIGWPKSAEIFGRAVATSQVHTPLLRGGPSTLTALAIVRPSGANAIAVK